MSFAQGDHLDPTQDGSHAARPKFGGNRFTQFLPSQRAAARTVRAANHGGVAMREVSQTPLLRIEGTPVGENAQQGEEATEEVPYSPERTPISPQVVERQTEKVLRKVANKSLAKALQSSITHIFPILITALLVTLSATRVYFGDLGGFAYQSIALQALQYCAKVHDLLMAASISEILLHRIRWDLLHKNGVPFGFLTAAYQLGDPFYFISSEFRAGVWKPRRHDRGDSRFWLTVLIVPMCLLSLGVGPSSGVLLVCLPFAFWGPSHVMVRSRSRH
jgi:hypothetical protein